MSGTKVPNLSVRVSRDTYDRLAALSSAANMRGPGAMAAALLGELVPRIASAAPRRGIAIELKKDTSATAASPRAAS